MKLIEELEQSPIWFDALSDQKERLCRIDSYLSDKEKVGPVYPMAGKRLAALVETPLDKIKSVWLAQDPYPKDHVINGEVVPAAMGLALSTLPGVPVQRSLKNMYKELNDDLGYPIPNSGDLTSWARQGVLLWNVVLTLDAGVSKSHVKSEWAMFTKAVLNAVNEQAPPFVFLSMGGDSHKMADFIDTQRHRIIKTSHPSPLGARKSSKDGSFCAFMGSKCFSRINDELESLGRSKIDWGTLAK
jgi:uracil-DNA glycosylase